MKTYKLVAIAAAALLTFASISAINYNVTQQPGAVANAGPAHVVNLAPVHVYPSAEERREVASSVADGAREDQASASFNLVSSALTMPQYSFGQKFGRISKE